jgi:hypothetical protein
VSSLKSRKGKKKKIITVGTFCMSPEYERILIEKVVKEYDDKLI